VRALVRPALAVLVVTGLGVASARRPGRDELAQPHDLAAWCVDDAACGRAPGKAPPPAVAILDHASARVAVVVVEAPALSYRTTTPAARPVLADAPKTSPPV
jgi:hypothetical protein